MNTPPPRVPPRFVPTLTEVVPGAVAIGAQSQAPGPVLPAGTGPLSEEQLVQRVMRRVQVDLDTRLREAVAQVVLEHTRGLAPALVVEVESVVRSLVSEALAQERGRQ